MYLKMKKKKKTSDAILYKIYRLKKNIKLGYLIKLNKQCYLILYRLLEILHFYLNHFF